MHKHPTSFMALKQLGTIIPAYQPTFDFQLPYINESHRALANCPAKDDVLIQLKDRRWFGRVIEGWLRREDALKLYELAYFATGDILELGSYHGLSSVILSQANRDSGYKKYVFCVDLDPDCVRITRRTLQRAGLTKQLQTMTNDALSAIRQLAAEGKQFEFVFIDHSHAYEPVYTVCRELDRVVKAGGFCLFHDFNDARNNDPEDKDYGVYQAVREGLSTDTFEFYGVYGAAALYRRILTPNEGAI